MRIGTCCFRTLASALLLLFPMVSAAEAPTSFRGVLPAMTLRPAPSRGTFQQELFGINPNRLILYSAPLPR